MGAFEQIFGLVRGEFEQKFSKSLNARGVPRGMLKLRFDWYIAIDRFHCHAIKKINQKLSSTKSYEIVMS